MSEVRDAPDGGARGGIVSPATDAAFVTIESLVALGVRHIVVSPGSRSQALALAADALERRGRIRMHVRIDERSAGFTALGIGRETGVPAALVCTSGTAVANYLPAVLEAHHAGVPLLLLTADRPPELRGVGANQTTDQVGVFGEALRFLEDAPVPDGTGGEVDRFQSIAVRAFSGASGGVRHDIRRLAHSRGVDPSASLAEELDDHGRRPRPPTSGRFSGIAGPAQINLPFREPLAGVAPAGSVVDPDAVRAQAARYALEASAPAVPGLGRPRVEEEADEPTPWSDVAVIEPGRRTVVLAGADAGAAAVEAARDGGWPLLAEVISGSRTTPSAIAAYRGALCEPALGGRIDRVVVFGHPTLNREATALLSRGDVEIISVRRGGEALNLNGGTESVHDIWVDGSTQDEAWLSQWAEWSRAHAGVVSGDSDAAPSAGSGGAMTHRTARDAPRAMLDRDALVTAVWRACCPADRLMFGSSRLVRVADDILVPRDIRVHANRGLAGIDGTVATALGVALASQGDGDVGGVTRVLLGDLAFLHDVGSLLLPEGEATPRIQVIVGNDGGGTIFDSLEVARVAGREAMDRVQYTPHNASLEHLAAAYGWAYSRVATGAELDIVLAAAFDRPHIVEVPLAR